MHNIHKTKAVNTPVTCKIILDNNSYIIALSVNVTANCELLFKRNYFLSVVLFKKFFE